MSYTQINDLPESVKAVLPEPAQEMFLEAFNHASEKYEDQELIYRTAWGAVRRDYQKCDDGKWHRKPQ